MAVLDPVAELHVVLGFIVKDAKFLLGVRKQGAEFAGLYEFIGGKVEPHETPEQALVRECAEEVGLQVTDAALIKTFEHSYPDKTIRFYCFWVDQFKGTAKPLHTDSVNWLDFNELATVPMPKANLPLKRLCLLSRLYYITPQTQTTAEFEQLLAQVGKLPAHSLVRFRGSYEPQDYLAKARALHAANPKLNWVVENGFESKLEFAVGVHFTSAQCRQLADSLSRGGGAGKGSERRLADHLLCMASAHNTEELKRAEQIGADAVCLSPFAATASHPNARPLGSAAFSELCQASSLPVFALGGVGPADLTAVKQLGGFGVAGIGAFFD